MGADVEIRGEQAPRGTAVINGPSTGPVAELQGELGPRRAELVERRRQVPAELARGVRPGFRKDTQDIRAVDWRVAPAPPDLRDTVALGQDFVEFLPLPGYEKLQ